MRRKVIKHGKYVLKKHKLYKMVMNISIIGTGDNECVTAEINMNRENMVGVESNAV